MRSASLLLFLVSIAPLSASFIVLAVADVGKGIWLVQISAFCLASLLAGVGARVFRASNQAVVGLVVVALVLLGLGAPLLGNSTQPQRWLPVGPFNLYMAPVLLPSLLAACFTPLGKRGRDGVVAAVALVVAGGLLAAHPDASQVLALCVGATVLLVQRKDGVVRSGVVLVGLVAATAWAFTQPDPLQPVPHVEEVFVLAFNQSWLAGVAVCGGAIAFLVGLCWRSRTMPWLLAVAAYYAVLYACSLNGLTPAPLVGYGTGPILGFGIMVAVSRALHLLESNTKTTSVELCIFNTQFIKY